MADDLFSASWYRVERLKPRLRGHIRLQRQQYRGQIWYVLHDLSTDRFHRFSPTAHVVIGLMDGQRTIHEVWEAANAQLGDDGPTQDEVIQLLSQLHGADVLVADILPNTAELARRAAQQARRKTISGWFNLFSFRIPLWDPDRFLSRVAPFIKPLLGPGAFALWLLVVGIGMAWGTLAGYAINPARDFGPRLASYLTGYGGAFKDQFGDLYFWVPIVGPIIGALIGALLYDLLVGRNLPVGDADEEVGRVPDEESAA